LELADVIKSLRQHWRVSVALVLLTGLALALFLITRKQTAPADRYQASIQILVPAIDSQGNRPVGVPASLLQGQVQRALNTTTETAALNAARVPGNKRRGIGFGFSANGTHDIIILSATAADAVTATTVAKAFETAYVATRSQTVADGATNALQAAQSAITKLRTKLASTETAIGAADPALLQSLLNGPRASSTAGSSSSTPSTAASQLPESTPAGTVLLVVQREAILTRIQSVEQQYAQESIDTLIPSGFAGVVEIDAPVQITPPLPSPFVPIVAFVAVGILLALAVPIVIDRLDRSIRTPKSAGAAFGATVLASIPPTSRRFRRALTVPGTPPEAAYRTLAATAIATDRLPQAIVVMAPTGIVQDTVAANFAAALAGLGLRVALVATDPRQSWFLDTRREEGTNGSEDPGLAFPQLLELAHRGRLNGALPRGLIKTQLNNLLVMPPGSGDEFSLDGLRPLLEALSAGGVDVTVIAGPALLEEPNATILAWTTRSVLWACETGEVTEGEAREAAARLELAGAESFGITMVDGKV
jgi:capsular polysaccharide biosynthesis protein